MFIIYLYVGLSLELLVRKNNLLKPKTLQENLPDQMIQSLI